MSLILDALRRADSERERGSVPGLHAQPLPALPVEPQVRPAARNWHWAVIGLAAGVVLSLLWYFTRSEAPRQRTDSVTAPAPTAASIGVPTGAPTGTPTAASTGAPTSAPATAPATASPAVPVSRASDAAGASLAAAVAAKPSRPLPVAEPAPWRSDDKRRAASRSAAAVTVPAATQEPPASQASATPTGATPTGAAPTTATPTTAPAAMRADSPPLTAAATLPGGASRGRSPAAPESPIYARDQLPPQIRSGLPPLAITGSIYSSRAADRTLIVNGRLLRENDQVGAGLLIEQIRQKSAVLRYKGYRFEVMF